MIWKNQCVPFETPLRNSTAHVASGSTKPDRVNALFKEVPQADGWGRARLVLTNEEDMLETGVDIEVQPPESAYKTWRFCPVGKWP